MVLIINHLKFIKIKDKLRHVVELQKN